MTHVLALTIGIVAGGGLMYRTHLRWAEAHHYRAVAISDDRARALAQQADHDYRSAVRWANAVNAMRAIHDDVVGDLLDTVADQRRRLADRRRPDTRPLHLARRRYSPTAWTYGRTRNVTVHRPHLLDPLGVIGLTDAER